MRGMLATPDTTGRKGTIGTLGTLSTIGAHAQ
jgi:hypothetical protein